MPTPFGKMVGRSFIKIRNNSGPKTLPWGTPEYVGIDSEKFSPILTLKERPFKKFSMNLYNFPLIPNLKTFLEEDLLAHYQMLS